MRSERTFRLFWIAALFLIQLRFLPDWELTSDDGNTLLAAHQLLRGAYWFGPSSSLGPRHAPFVYFLWSLFFRFSDSVRAVQIGILLTRAAATWLLIEAGRRLGGARYGYLASALAFVSTGSFVFFGQKFWEPAALPLFTMLAFFSLLEWGERRDPRFLALCFASILLATSAHLNALFLYAAVVPALWLLRRETSAPPWVLAFGAVTAGVALAPFLAWPEAGRIAKPALAGLAALPIAVLVTVLGKRVFGVAALAALAALLAAGLGLAPPPPVFSSFAELVGVFPAEIARRVGAPVFAPAWVAVAGALPVALFLLRASLGLAALDRSRQLLFLWLVVPLVVLAAEALALGHFYSHWALFLLPAAWLAAADSLLWLAALPGRPALRIAARFAAACLLVAYAADSWRLTRFVEKTGGVGEHLATLSAREAVLTRIDEAPGKPELFEVNIPYRYRWYLGYRGWTFLRELRLQHEWSGRPAPGRYFYVFQDGSPTGSPDLLPTLRSAPGVREERFGSLILFTSDRFVEGAGVAVR